MRTIIRWVLAPPAFFASLALWPLTVLWAHWHRTWADGLALEALTRDTPCSPRLHP